MAEDPPVLKVSGDTTTYVQHDDAAVGTIDVDQNVALEYWLFKLALNAGYTLTFPAKNAVSWGYALTYAQAFGPFSVSASLASDSMAYTFGTGMAGGILDDIKVGAAFAKDAFAANVDLLLSAVSGYALFQGLEVGAGFLPKWGYVRVGMDLLDAQAVTDDVGYVNAPAALEGLSFFAKAQVKY
jgi:hypothetical protein